jgi:cell division protein FtsI/penicillin-binding protein 2
MRWIDRFGFGSRTGIEFPGETKGIVLPAKRWSGSTIGNVPIGQGIAVTPLQMVAAYGALANKGIWVQPHLIEKISGEKAAEPKRRRILTTQTALQVRHMLREVVEEGSGTAAQVPGYRIAGKTGTAAKPDDQGGYSDYLYVGSFVGFVPAKAPRLVILVTVDEPRGAIYGGVVAAPAFAEIAKFALQYLEVAPR